MNILLVIIAFTRDIFSKDFTLYHINNLWPSAEEPIQRKRVNLSHTQIPRYSGRFRCS